MNLIIEGPTSTLLVKRIERADRDGIIRLPLKIIIFMKSFLKVHLVAFPMIDIHLPFPCLANLITSFIICKMRQKFWKQLKSRLCPRQNWVRDSDSPRCQCCGKQFSFFRRRHHCRFCGKLFCGHCSSLFVNGTYLALSEKYVRHCQFCREEINKLKQDLNRLTYMVQQEEDFARSEDDGDDAESSSDEDDEYFSVRVIFGSQEKEEGEVRFAEELQQEIRGLAKRMLGRLVELGSVPGEYLGGKLMEMLLRAVVECRMNILPLDLHSKSSYMDIARQLSIRTLIGTPGEHLQLVRGVVLEKSLPVKHMLSRLLKPQLIVIQNSLDESGVKVRFQDLINNQHAIYEQLQERIMKFNPDIVLVEHTTSRQLLNFFAEKGIAVISGLKKKDMQRIVHLAGVRNTVKNIWAIDRYRPGHLVGSLDLMHIRSFQHNPDPFIYFERNVGVYSLLVSQRTHQAQTALKRALQVLLRLMRQANLEKYLIYLDFQMWEERDSKQAPRLRRINSRYLDTLECMRCEQVEFYRLRLSEMKLQKQEKKIREYCKAKSRKVYLDACGEGTHQAILAYSQHDNTIGHFLLVMATGLVRRCSECRLEHRQRYYFGGCGVELSVRKAKEEGMREEIEDESDLNIEKMHKYLKKYKENWNIFSYVQCKNCSAVLSKQVKVGKNYLKNSFYYFLFLVAHSEPPESKKQQKYVTSSNALKDCTHGSVERVLQTSDIRFGMEVFSVERYSLRLIDLKAEEYLSIYRESSKKYINQLVNAQIEQKFTLQEMLANIVDSYICLLDPFRFHEQADSRLIIELQKLQSIREILDQLKAHLEQLWNRQKGKEYTYTSDWTFFQREAAKVDAAFKTIIDILRVVQGALHKRKRKIEENEMMSVYTSEETDSLLEAQNYRSSVRYREERGSMQVLDEFDFKRINSRQNLEELIPALQRQKSGEQSQRSEKSLKSIVRKVSHSVLTFSLVYNQPRLRAYSQEMRRRRYQLKKGQFLYFNLVNYKKVLSVLVCALNSTDFREQLQKRPGEAFKYNLILSKEIPTSWDLKQRLDKVRGENVEDQGQSRDSYEITTYFHKEFQSLRETQGISQEVYIRSLANSEFWETMGGKSNSEFAKSQDELLVIKSIKPDEFDEFLKFASDYLKHLRAINRDSFLTKVYGIYEVVIKGDSYKYVVMQNLFLGFQGLPFRKYDLKGSQLNRLFLPKAPEVNPTGMDTNFKVDKNYHPYFIQQKSYRRFFNALEEDVHFLCKNEVIDYSLLVIEHERQLRVGIIDFMRPYHLMERIENKYKQLTNKNEPTVIPPQEYANRFLLAMRKYFAFYR